MDGWSWCFLAGDRHLLRLSGIVLDHLFLLHLNLVLYCMMVWHNDDDTILTNNWSVSSNICYLFNFRMFFPSFIVIMFIWVMLLNTFICLSVGGKTFTAPAGHSLSISAIKRLSSRHCGITFYGTWTVCSTSAVHIPFVPFTISLWSILLNEHSSIWAEFLINMQMRPIPLSARRVSSFPTATRSR